VKSTKAKDINEKFGVDSGYAGRFAVGGVRSGDGREPGRATRSTLRQRGQRRGRRRQRDVTEEPPTSASKAGTLPARSGAGKLPQIVIATPIGVLQRAAYGSRTNSIRRTSISALPPAAYAAHSKCTKSRRNIRTCSVWPASRVNCETA
jgi:hypothetical protein